MTDAQPSPPNSEFDDELKQALAAFGDDALSLLDEDDMEEMSEETLATIGETSTITPVREFDVLADDDDSPLIRYVKELSRAIYSGGRSESPSDDPLPSDEQRSATGAPRFVVFTVGEHQLGVPLSNVSEIARYPVVTELPRTPSWLRGVTNLRGQILSVTDLRNLLHVDSERPLVGEKIIVVHSKQNATSTAIVVDRVLGIRSFAGEQGNVADLKHHVATIASGTASIDQTTTGLIDPDQLFQCVELLLTFAS